MVKGRGSSVLSFLVCLVMIFAASGPSWIYPIQASPQGGHDPLDEIISAEARLSNSPEDMSLRQELIGLLLRGGLYERALTQLSLVPGSMPLPSGSDAATLIEAIQAYIRYDEALDIARLFLSARDYGRAATVSETLEELFPACSLTAAVRKEVAAGAAAAHHPARREAYEAAVAYLKDDRRAMASLMKTEGLEPAVLSQMAVLLARAFLDDGDFASAASNLERAVSLDGQNAAAWSLLGRCRHGQGLLREAREAYGHALQLQPHDVLIEARLEGLAFLSGQATSPMSTEAGGPGPARDCGLGFLASLWDGKAQEPSGTRVETPPVSPPESRPPRTVETRPRPTPETATERPAQRRKSQRPGPESAEKRKGSLLKKLVIGGVVGGGVAALIAVGGSDNGGASGPEATGSCADWSGTWRGTLESTPGCSLRVGAGTYTSTLNVTQTGTAVRIQMDRLPPLEGLACFAPALAASRSDGTAAYETSWTCSDTRGSVYRYRWSGQISCSAGSLRWDSDLSADKDQRPYCTWQIRATYTR